MTAPQQQAVQQPQKAQPLAPSVRDVFFLETPVSIGMASASVGEKDVVSIIPGCIDSASRVCTASDAGERPSDGLLVTLRKTGRDGKAFLKSSLVPWKNIRDVALEDVEIAQTKAA